MGIVAPRSQLRWFAEEMEATLKRNDYKGEWNDCSTRYLLDGVKRETIELENALLEHESKADIIAECTDVANFCMMLANKVRSSK